MHLTQRKRCQARIRPQKNACGYGARVSGATHYNYYRNYLASQGRYTQNDPVGLGGGLNRMTYASGNPLGRYDPFGLSDLLFDAPSGTLWVFDKSGNFVDAGPAANNAASNSNGQWPAGTFPFEKYNPHPNYSSSSDVGTDFFGFTVPGRSDMGVHAGRQGKCDRAGRCGYQHATMGCIRVEPTITDSIRNLHATDPVKTITVRR